MMSMDIAALGAAPSPDAACASAEVPASAADVFAAMLDDAAGAAGDADNQSPAADEAGEEDLFDEMAALAMTSLLNINVPVQDAPDTAVAETGDVAIDADVTTESTDSRVTTDAATQMVLVDAAIAWPLTPAPSAEASGESDDTSGAQAAGETAWPTTRVQTTSVPTTPNVLTDATSSDAPGASASDASTDAASTTPANDTMPANDTTPADGGTRSETPTSTGKVDADVPVAKSARAPKPSRGEHAKTANVDGAHARAAHAPLAAAAAGQPIAEARVAAQAQDVSEIPRQGTSAAASAAVRFARALERAAGAAAGESSPAAATVNTNGGGQASTSGEGSPDREMPSFAAPRHAGQGAVSFTVAAPAAIESRMLSRALDAARHIVDTNSTPIPERDVVAQLVQSLRMQFRDGIGEAVVKLNPEHLGSVQVSIKVENGAIKATVQADVASVRQWLESQQDTLRNGLAEHGLRLERFVVEPDRERQASREDEQPREQRRRQEQRRRKAETEPIFEVTV